jgi:hypothetical protein
MDDLRVVIEDPAPATSPRNRAGFGGAGDRPRRRADLVVAALLAGCAGGPAGAGLAPAQAELWCDASAPAGGDGTRARPARVLPAELGPGVQVHAASGIYPGPLRLGPGASLTGAGVVVVTASGPGPVVSLAGASLRRVSVQGADLGVEATGVVELEDVHFSGHRLAALRAGPGASVSAHRLVVEGTIPGSDGLVGEGARLAVKGARFGGALRRAVAVRGGELTLEGAAAEGPATLLHAVDAAAVVRDGAAAGGRGPAVFAAGGRLEVKGLSVLGHEYAVQAARGEVALEGVTSRGAQRGGVALLRTTGRVRGLLVERAGEEGGLLLDQASTAVEDVTVRGAASWGVLVRLGRAELGGVTLESIRAESGAGFGVLGDGLVVRDAEVDGGVVRASDVEGAGLLASAEARVRLEVLEVARSGGPGAQVERASSLHLGQLRVHGAWGPALVATEGGQGEVGVLSARGVEAPVWADCESGARVAVERLEGAPAPLPSRCVRVGPSASRGPLTPPAWPGRAGSR